MPNKTTRKTPPKKADFLYDSLSDEDRQQQRDVIMDQWLNEKPPITKEFDASKFISNVITALQNKNTKYHELTEDKQHRSVPLYNYIYSYVHNKLRNLNNLNQKIRDERDKREKAKADDSFATYNEDDPDAEEEKKEDEGEIRDTHHEQKYDDFGSEIKDEKQSQTHKSTPDFVKDPQKEAEESHEKFSKENSAAERQAVKRKATSTIDDLLTAIEKEHAEDTSYFEYLSEITMKHG